VLKTHSGFGPSYYIVSIIAQFILGVLAAIIVGWYSCHREFCADVDGALAERKKTVAAVVVFTGSA